MKKVISNLELEILAFGLSDEEHELGLEQWIDCFNLEITKQ